MDDEDDDRDERDYADAWHTGWDDEEFTWIESLTYGGAALCVLVGLLLFPTLYAWGFGFLDAVIPGAWNSH